MQSLEAPMKSTQIYTKARWKRPEIRPQSCSTSHLRRQDLPPQHLQPERQDGM